MNNAIWKQNFVKAEQAVAGGDRHITRQKQLIAELERDGHDGEAARALLVQFESTQALHIAHRDRLRRQLERQNAT